MTINNRPAIVGLRSLADHIEVNDLPAPNGIRVTETYVDVTVYGRDHAVWVESLEVDDEAVKVFETRGQLWVQETRFGRLPDMGVKVRLFWVHEAPAEASFPLHLVGA